MPIWQSLRDLKGNHQGKWKDNAYVAIIKKKLKDDNRAKICHK